MRHHILQLMFWLFLFSTASGDFGKKYGIPYLLLDPEYLGNISFWSFFIVGLAYAAFVITYNSATYILNVRFFSFLGSIRKPFISYSINNAILPISFIIYLSYKAYYFQRTDEYKQLSEALINVSGLWLGFIMAITISLLYFFNTGIDFMKVLGVPFGAQKTRRIARRVILKENKDLFSTIDIRVDHFLNRNVKIERTHGLTSYSTRLLKNILRKSQANAIFLQVLSFVSLLIIGIFHRFEFMQVPSGAGIFLILASINLFLGVFNYWFGTWRTIVFFCFLLIFNQLYTKFSFQKPSRAYGLNYNSTPADYSIESLEEMSKPEILQNSIKEGLSVLENWKKQVSKNPNEKPLLILCNVSGGGLRSALWTFSCLQTLDSATNGEFFKHTVLVSGASGGIIASAFYREIMLQKQLNPEGQTQPPGFYVDQLSRDVLNPIVFSIATNDIFVRFQRYHYGGNTYTFDRGTALEMALNRNTNGMLNKKVMDYAEPERMGIIPQMVLSPTIMNDSRRLLISPLDVAFLSLLPDSAGVVTYKRDAVEFNRLFAGHQADSFSFLSALRMNATFPYITPAAVLPTKPLLEVMDAGFRDNFGIEISARYFNAFRKWILENTSGVVVLQIRDTPTGISSDISNQSTWLSRFFTPLNSLLVNWQDLQEFSNDRHLFYMSQLLKDKMHFVTLKYQPANETEQVSLSWHLTSKEKLLIRRALSNKNNVRQMEKLQNLLLPQQINP